MWVDEEVGRMARKIRERRGVSIERMANELDVSPSDIRRMEDGRARMGAQTLFVYANFLQFPISVFFEWQHDRPEGAKQADRFRN